MKIIEQSHSITSLPDGLLETLEQVGRDCYQSQDKITPESSEKFVKMLRDRGHHAMIEFGDIIVRFITNRGVTHELVRHRMCSFAQESTRYVNYKGGMEFIRPVWCPEEMLGDYTPERLKENMHKMFPGNEIQNEGNFLFALFSAEKSYQELIRFGWRPEQAREVLPNALKTVINVKANIREWRHIFTLRCSKKAHPQIRALMIPILKELQGILPVVFDDIEV